MKTVGDVQFGNLLIKYGKGLQYEWTVNGDITLHYATTRQLTSQRKFRDKYLEATGQMLQMINTPAWLLIVNKAYSEAVRYEEELREDMWLRRVAEYVVNERTEDAREISKGKVLETKTGFVFTSLGLARFLATCEDMSIFTPEWHSEKVRTLLNTKSMSLTLDGFQGRAIKINNYSGRVDRRFYDYVEARLATM